MYGTSTTPQTLGFTLAPADTIDVQVSFEDAVMLDETLTPDYEEFPAERSGLPADLPGGERGAHPPVGGYGMRLSA